METFSDETGKKTMKHDEFIKLCSQCGYSNRETAEKYAEGREEFTDDDFIEVYRIRQRAIEMHNAQGKWHSICGAKTTKHYPMGSRKR